MILVIDGYNVIHRARIMLSEPLERQREELIRLAAGFRRKKDVEAVIFFDSNTHAEFLDRPDHPLVKVIFAQNESADDAIVHWVSAHKNAGEIEVATDDKSLRSRSKHWGAKSISVEELMHRFRPESFTKPSNNSRAEESGNEKPTNNYYISQQINKTLPWGK